MKVKHNQDQCLPKFFLDDLHENKPQEGNFNHTHVDGVRDKKKNYIDNNAGVLSSLTQPNNLFDDGRTNNNIINDDDDVLTIRMPSTTEAIPNTIRVKLVKQKHGGLGFLVKQRTQKPLVVVADLVAGGIAEESGLVQVSE